MLGTNLESVSTAVSVLTHGCLWTLMIYSHGIVQVSLQARDFRFNVPLRKRMRGWMPPFQLKSAIVRSGIACHSSKPRREFASARNQPLVSIGKNC